MHRVLQRFIPLGAVLAVACATASEPPAVRTAVVEAIRQHARPVANDPGDYDDLLELIGDNQFVLLGDATHGTSEFYRERARITRRLIVEKGFTVVAIEADWPDAYDLNEFVHGRGPASAEAALSTFDRFPRWMWGNRETAELLQWMREHNQSAGRNAPVGIYGLDLYSVPESVDAVLAFLRTDDPAAATRAARRYACFDRYRRGGMQEYGREVAGGTGRGCSAAAAEQFQELSIRVTRDGTGHRPGDDELVSAWQSARVVLNGEAYYRSMYVGGVASWNLRDSHMADTIDALSAHLNEGAETRAKLIVWAHNSHLGDARVTERSERGEHNVGQLMRQRHDGQSVLIGLTTYNGTVLAAAEWGAEGRAQPLRPALPGSFSALFHETGLPAFTLRLRGNSKVAQALAGSRLQRFVGVIYAPQTERQSHYFETDLSRQYDAVIHIDRTTAVAPLPRRSGEWPEHPPDR